MTTAPLVEIDGVTKRFGATLALDAVTLTLGSGVTGLLGPNGAGKTTLIRVLSTAEAPSSRAGPPGGRRPQWRWAG